MKKWFTFAGVLIVVALVASILTGVVLAQGPRDGNREDGVVQSQEWQGRGSANGVRNEDERPYANRTEDCDGDCEFVDEDGDGICDLMPEDYPLNRGERNSRFEGRSMSNGNGQNSQGKGMDGRFGPHDDCDCDHDDEPQYDGEGPHRGWSNR